MTEARNSKRLYRRGRCFCRFPHLPFSVSDLFRISCFGFRLYFATTVLVTASLSGCVKDFGTGGTGELVISQERLRRVERLDPDAFAKPPEAVAPLTMPATEPAAGPTVLPTTLASATPTTVSTTAPGAVATTLPVTTQPADAPATQPVKQPAAVAPERPPEMP